MMMNEAWQWLTGMAAVVAGAVVLIFFLYRMTEGPDLPEDLPPAPRA